MSTNPLLEMCYSIQMTGKSKSQKKKKSPSHDPLDNVYTYTPMHVKPYKKSFTVSDLKKCAGIKMKNITNMTFQSSNLMVDFYNMKT